MHAEKLLQWMKNNKVATIDFAMNIFTELQACCHHPRTVKFTENIWQKYYQLSASDNFRTSWCNFFHQALVSLLPQFFTNI